MDKQRGILITMKNEIPRPHHERTEITTTAVDHAEKHSMVPVNIYLTIQNSCF